MSHQDYRPRTLGGQAIARSVNALREPGSSFWPKKEAGVRCAAPSFELKDRHVAAQRQGHPESSPRRRVRHDRVLLVQGKELKAIQAELLAVVDG